MLAYTRSPLPPLLTLSPQSLNGSLQAGDMKWRVDVQQVEVLHGNEVQHATVDSSVEELPLVLW